MISVTPSFSKNSNFNYCPSTQKRIPGVFNRPRSIYQYSSMAPRLSGQTSYLVLFSFVSKSLLGIERQKKLEKFAILT